MLYKILTRNIHYSLYKHPVRKTIFHDIHSLLKSGNSDLNLATQYFFEDGKCVRPIILYEFNSVFSHIIPTFNSSSQVNNQMNYSYKLCMIVEMIHTASLIHDDVIDNSILRRGRRTIENIRSTPHATWTGTYILGAASSLLGTIQIPQITILISQLIDDLIKGELLQMGIRFSIKQRLDHYLKKTYCKTASLFANGCEAIAVNNLNNNSSLITSSRVNDIIKLSNTFGKSFGMMFQLIDDLLDYEADQNAVGKPTTADLKLGLATAPVLFAAEDFPQLNEMIERKFNEVDDVQLAFDYVSQSNGKIETFNLAKKYADEAKRNLEEITSLVTGDRTQLNVLYKYVDEVLYRKK
ncbi:hypothetical protein SNEBB_006787 [Seison nebaliae]|nr:hypothetical protein SNEBB_006787 [Seison nebaliae]